MFTQPTRRDFLQASAIIAGSLILPRSLFSAEPDKFFFLHADTNDCWPVSDPVQWSLENVHDPILERASEGLLKLTPNDGDRIIRLVVRRCGLNLIELQPRQVVVHHWGQQGLADLRPFFKSHGLARKDIKVVVNDRKKEVVATETGDDFLYGEQLAEDFPLALFQSKWQSRFVSEPDDWTAAPERSSGFEWEGIEDNRIPWSALKSAWRRSSPRVCLNCDQPTTLVNFGLRPVGMFNRSPNFVRVCGDCRRSFRDESVKDVDGWMIANLNVAVRLGFVMRWERRVEWAGA